MKRYNMVYPVMDEINEKRVELSSERLLYGESEYYFSPKFKQSKEILDGVLKGYVRRGKVKIGRFKNKENDLIVCNEFNDEVSKEIRRVLSDLKSKDGVILLPKEVLGYFENGMFKVLLTSNMLYSDYGRDYYESDSVNDPKGFYVKCLLKDTQIIKNKIITGYGDNEEIYTFDGEFSENFHILFNELKELTKTVKLMPGLHPLSNEKRILRENYIGMLVDKSLEDGMLSANEVVRLEILARQIGIDSITVINLIKKALDRFNICEKDVYINESLKKMEYIAKDYYYMLYHDLLTFELLAKKGKVEEIKSDFVEVYSNRYSIEEKFRESYKNSMQKLVVSSYSLRDTLINKGIRIENKNAFLNLCESVDYEYTLQKELLN